VKIFDLKRCEYLVYVSGFCGTLSWSTRVYIIDVLLPIEAIFDLNFIPLSSGSSLHSHAACGNLLKQLH
jgi:hypothetical protein